MTGIDLFLTHRIYGSEQHPRGWEKYVYDDENVHCGLLKLLSERCPMFAQSILRMPRLPNNISVLFEPERGLFDLAFRVDDSVIYCETKVWSGLSNDQFLRQMGFLEQQDARGIYILFTKAADAWSPDLVLERSQGRCHVIGISNLLQALEVIGGGLPKDLAEVVSAYRNVLIHLHARWSNASAGDRAA